MTLEPVTIDGDKVTCGSQSVEIWLSGIALYYADNWGESPGEVTFEEAEELIEALKVAVVEGRRMEAEREKQNAIDEATWKAANPQYCPSEDGPVAIEAWRSRYCLPPYCRAYNALSCMAQEADRRKRCWCKEDAEGQLAK